jgi:hypothetical protein
VAVFLENNVSTVDELVRDFEWGDSPATPAQVAEVAAALRMSVPPDLADLLTSRGSGGGFIGEGGFLSLFPLEDWASHHEMLNAATRWPGLLIFGNDGGNGLFGFDQETQQYVEVDAIGEEDRRPYGKSLVEFLNTIANLRFTTQPPQRSWGILSWIKRRLGLFAVA